VGVKVEAPTGEQVWTTQVVVVGSGAGGSMAALTLAEAGLDVIVLEEGHQHSRYPPDLGTAARVLYQESGTRQFEGSSPAPVASGKALGGSTVVNSAICFRTPEEVLASWNEASAGAFGEPASYYALQDEIEALFGVATTPDELLSGCDLAHKRAAQRLGWAEHNLRRNAPGCGGCSRCNQGCPIGGKASADLVALPRAHAAGARLLTGCRVQRVGAGLVEGELRDREGLTVGRFSVKADRVVLAAGTVSTPGLLLASGLQGNGTVGQGFQAHPTAGAYAMLREPVHRRGAAQGHGVVEFVDRRILLESNPMMPAAIFAALPLYGRRSIEVMRRGDHLVCTGGLVRDAGGGQVLVPNGEAARVQWSMGDEDRRRLIELMRLGCQLWLEGAGAEWVVPTRHGARMCGNMDEVLRELPEDLPPELISTYCSHPQSSCGIGRTCAADGEVIGHPGVHCADASLLPSAVGRNPQISVMTVATLVARRIAEGLGGSVRPVVSGG
jgi:choline dehydrogenase-like flavoprotein